ncbi:MAG TPA: FtsX-like permease family protein [Candidatus Binatia bacterium]|nr:FtsX-like permease family protein [Candidatus Binatia bacterium]
MTLLGSVSLLNTLVMATIERRRALILLRRIGATARQVISMTIWQTAVLCVVGIALGAAAATASLLMVAKSLTGTCMPYLTWPPMAIIGETAVGLTLIAILVPTAWLLTRPAGGG